MSPERALALKAVRFRTWSRCSSRSSPARPIHRGTFTSVADLIAAIENFTDGWNDRCQPFTWTNTADDILAHARPKVIPTSATAH